MRILFILSLCLLGAGAAVPGLAGAEEGPPPPAASFGWRLPGSEEEAILWWASSGWKIGRSWTPPVQEGGPVLLRAAKNEAEAAQIVVRPERALKGFRVRVHDLEGSNGAVISRECVEVLRVRYVEIVNPTDASARPGPWPDPLPPIAAPIDLAAGMNHPLWIRVTIPRDAAAGIHEGRIDLLADGFEASVPIRVEAYAFTLPDRMSCTTAFGFSPDNVWAYHGLTREEDKRAVLDMYWADFSAHHISPYDPAPLDRIIDDWPEVKPRPRRWEGGLYVTNEVRQGKGALLVLDDDRQRTVTATYHAPVEIPEGGLRLRFQYRTLLPGHRFLVSLNHLDSAGRWMPNRNNDITVMGNGTWEEFDRSITRFPEGAESVMLRLMATRWTEEGTDTGGVWYDELSLLDAATGEALVEGGDFEEVRPFEPVDPSRLVPRLDFSTFDGAMERAIDRYHFNSFRLRIPGMGGGSFHAIQESMLLGYTDDAPEYWTAFEGYCRRLEDHLGERGWLDEAYVYWFDEPSPEQYAFVVRGFDKLRRAAPGIGRMLTEQVEPELIGGPNIWCSISNRYDHERAEERRRFGEKFWWYICTGPKAPYAGLFIDHPGTELRVWLWQTFQRGIEGILVWQTNYWTSRAAYPDPASPQNPYEDPMGWVSGYSTPGGVKRPWGNGDGRFIYPPERCGGGRPGRPVLEGPVDSIRWEMLRDGIEDYEYLALLRGLLEEAGPLPDGRERAEQAGLLRIPAEITSDLTHFTKDPSPIEKRRHEIARAIELLSRPR